MIREIINLSPLIFLLVIALHLGLRHPFSERDTEYRSSCNDYYD